MDSNGGTGGTMRRRGLIAGAAALVAGIAAKQAAQPVAAAHQPEDVGLGIDNTPPNAPTRILAGSSFSSGGTAVFVASASAGNGNVNGLFGKGGGQAAAVVGLGDGANAPDILTVRAGVYGVGTSSVGPTNAGPGVRAVGGAASGLALSGFGVHALSGDANTTPPAISSPAGIFAAGPGNGYGVYGVSQGGNGNGGAGVYGFGNAGTGVFGDGRGTGGTGVRGNGTAIGVEGLAPFGTGVHGQVPTGSATNNTIGVFGENNSTGTGGIGVYGTSQSGYGVLGVSNKSGFAGCTGSAFVAGGAAFAGGTATPGAYAAYFTGPVVVDGDFTVLDPARKHGAIKHPDGSHRTLYSMESPESWLEDFGEAQLSGGKAEVRLDADFAAVIEGGAYHVFLSSHDAANKGLAVTARRPDGFVVQEQHGGTSGGGFSYRVVAKPKTEKRAARMAKFDPPKITIPAAHDLPKPPPSSDLPKPPTP